MKERERERKRERNREREKEREKERKKERERERERERKKEKEREKERERERERERRRERKFQNASIWSCERSTTSVFGRKRFPSKFATILPSVVSFFAPRLGNFWQVLVNLSLAKVALLFKQTLLCLLFGQFF